MIDVFIFPISLKQGNINIIDVCIFPTSLNSRNFFTPVYEKEPQLTDL